MNSKYREFKDAFFVQFQSKDGLNLPGLLFPANSDKVAIFIHGNGSSSVFYYNDYSLPRELLKKGISTLMFNNRGAHLIHKLDKYDDNQITRSKYGMAYEMIREVVLDVDGALDYLKAKGFKKFYLIGGSTGANKIVVYNKYKPKNPFDAYVLIAGGDDLGVYFNKLGREGYQELIKDSKEKIEKGKGDEIVKQLLPDYFFSYKSFFDIANPEGDYNIFPYFDYFLKLKLTKKKLFNEFSLINKSSLIIYGEDDEYAWGKVDDVVELLKSIKPEFTYKVIKKADHKFNNQIVYLAKVVADWLEKQK